MRKRVSNRPRYRHGHKPRSGQSAEYVTWESMIARCENESHRSYKDYGGRGIKVCPQWREDFAAFLRDMGSRPGTQHSIERIDNDGDYTPGNCRWATIREQADNRRTNRFIEFQGKRLTIAQWSAHTGLRPDTISKRLKRGLSIGQALLTPPAPREADHAQVSRCRQ